MDKPHVPPNGLHRSPWRCRAPWKIIGGCSKTGNEASLYRGSPCSIKSGRECLDYGPVGHRRAGRRGMPECYGSNLTMEGAVECDAAIMDGKTGDFASVGAVSGVKNPIMLANAILEHSREPDLLGRIRPMTLVSSGAHSFATKHGLQTVSPENMISPRATDDWKKWMDRFNSQVEPESLPIPQDAMQDTVGAVAWDSDGNMAAGVSSGGLLLKYSGRVGEQAATFGAGCWAQQSSDGRTGMACSISGAGEHIMRVGLARLIGAALQAEEGQCQDQKYVDVHEQLVKTLLDDFHDPTLARGDSHPNAGALLLTKEPQEEGHIMPRLWCTFTSESMAVSYASSAKPLPKASILRRPSIAHTTPSTKESPVYITALPLH
ncbi:nucleophile aminohydrolase [Phlebopus sp. FC_14]|nr:nucleophile aminohydrolase [Phlebopus sp. FC_14]